MFLQWFDTKLTIIDQKQQSWFFTWYSPLKGLSVFFKEESEIGAKLH